MVAALAVRRLGFNPPRFWGAWAMDLAIAPFGL
jgi:hypothetical protein